MMDFNEFPEYPTAKEIAMKALREQIKEEIEESIVNQAWHTIYLDGVKVYQTLSSRKCIKERNKLLKSRKHGWTKFDHLKIIDPERNHTDFLFNQNDPGVEAMRALLRKDK